jgi:hypothetical protein
MRDGSKPVLWTVAKDGRRLGRPKNTDVRTREHLTSAEVEMLVSAARPRGRYGLHNHNATTDALLRLATGMYHPVLQHRCRTAVESSYGPPICRYQKVAYRCRT